MISEMLFDRTLGLPISCVCMRQSTGNTKNFKTSYISKTGNSQSTLDFFLVESDFIIITYRTSNKTNNKSLIGTNKGK